VNLALKGYWNKPINKLSATIERSSEILHLTIPNFYPAFGRDAFRTGTGVHAAAIIKALQRDDKTLADMIYSGVPASMVGRRQEIEVGPVAGHSNVHFWLRTHGFEDRDDYVEVILQHAKKGNHILSDAEIRQVLREHDPAIRL
jgi:2-isopropylmalate synthase